MSALSEEQGRLDSSTLAAAMDRVIPTAAGLPGAGAMGVGPEIEARAASQSWLDSAVKAVLDALAREASEQGKERFDQLDPEGQDAVLQRVESSFPDEFGSFLDLVYTVYYMQPEVHRAIGWHGRTPQPDGNEMAPFDESVLAVACKREPFWRKV